MGLAEVMMDFRGGTLRRILDPSLRAWAASHPADSEVLEVGAGYYDLRPYFQAKLVRFDADASHETDIVGDAHDMPIEDDRYDAALAVALIEHVDDPYQVVREMYRVLRPGGRVFAWIPFYFGVHGFPEDVSRFTTYGMRQLFERAGFEITRIDEEPYAGLFLQAANTVHYVLPRQAPERWKRWARWVLFPLARAGFPLDRRFGLRLHTLYAGAEVEAVKPLR